MEGALGMSRFIEHYHRETWRGRFTAAPAGVALSLVLHIACILAVTFAWKAGAPVPVIDVTLVNAARPATAEHKEMTPPAHAPARKPPAQQQPVNAAREKSPVKQASETQSPPATSSKPVRTEAPAPRETVPEAGEVSATAAKNADTAGTRETGPPVAAGSAAATEEASPAPGMAVPDAIRGTRPGVDIASLERSYTDRLRELIERFIRYPVFARKARIEGTCMVTCKIERSGAVTGIDIARSSGHELLDKAALNAVRDAGSFPPPPRGLCGDELEVMVPVSFSLTDR